MWTQFILENIHFAINLFAALVMFAIMWLYVDAWQSKKNLNEGLRVLGFGLLAVSFLIQSVFVESSLLSNGLISPQDNWWLVIISRIGGYLVLLINLLLDPIQDRPHYQISEIGSQRSDPRSPKSKHPNLIAVAGLGFGTPAWVLLFPVLAAIVGFLYLRKATEGLENHLKPVALGFFVLSLAEMLALQSLFQSTPNVELYKIVAPFGPLWILQQLTLLAAILILGKWVFGYLLKRLQTQLFMIFNLAVLVIFLVTSVGFTFLLLHNFQNDSLKQLETDVRVLNLSFDSKKEETISNAQILAQNPQLQAAIESNSRKELQILAQSFLLTKKVTSVVITSETGQVLARGEDPEKVGASLSDDPLIKRSLVGETVAAPASIEGILSPEIYIRAAAPIQSSGATKGVVMVSYTIDNAFVDGIKQTTGLEASVYGDNLLSATTLVSEDGTTRLNGIKEEDPLIKEQVLEKGGAYSGSVTISSLPYFAAILPLKDLDNNPNGMLLVARLQSSILTAAAASIQLTFIITALLLVLSIIPAYFISKFISGQIK